MKTFKELINEARPDKPSKAAYEFAKEVIRMHGMELNTGVGIDIKKKIVFVNTDDGDFEFSYKLTKRKK